MLADGRYLCVSLHDVAPATWRACQQVLSAVREVAEVPLTLLVVPAYRGQCSALADGFEAAMSGQVERGHELALHGYFHQDPGVPESIVDWFRRRVYTAGEGEFWDLGEREASERLVLGEQWFRSNHWPLAGFVPPAWLMGPGAWKAVRRCPTLQYVTTFGAIHDLQAGDSLQAPCVTFSTRKAWRRVASVVWAGTAQSHCAAPLLRFALHPHDASYPRLRRAWQRRLERLLQDRLPVTKAQFVAQWRSMPVVNRNSRSGIAASALARESKLACRT